MKEFKQVITTYGNYYQKRKDIDREFKTGMEAAEEYNAKIKSDRQTELITNQRTNSVRLRQQYNELFANIKESVKVFVAGKFTMTLSAEDEATLNNLEKIDLSDAEIELQIDKYKDNPLVLRRLYGLYGGGNDTIKKMLLLSSEKDYSYYMKVYDDFANLAISGMDSLDAADPMQVDHEYSTITADLVIKALENELTTIEQEFVQLESN
ncbi:hypothetical protein M2139_000315 [Enterococcus sp. PF1-24]|uniref:hypothetical protein n=1 Tax=unclassified Enterococcus TaxID=2608891 RepID=UPI0024743DD3|nr:MULTISPECIES: hypothetical protein [unclassified Enterococcus]MDH6363265.1 hypothetical protein [Enterococcus sp. PFB1-1]MDH6400434.1 hypothetical protein [Enterococcus sp. PF1-24]